MPGTPRPGNGNPHTLKGKGGRGPKPGTERKCTPQELIFIDSYVNCWNATTAATDAGYSAKTAYSTGNKVKNKPWVKDEIERRLQDVRADYRYDHRAFADFLMRILYQDTTEILEIIETKVPGKPDEVKQEIKFKSSSMVKNGVGRYFNSIALGRHGHIKVELFSKQVAAEMLARHIGFYEKDNDQKKPIGPTIYLPDNGREQDNQG